MNFEEYRMRGKFCMPSLFKDVGVRFVQRLHKIQYKLNGSLHVLINNSISAIQVREY